MAFTSTKQRKFANFWKDVKPFDYDDFCPAVSHAICFAYPPLISS